MAQKGFTQNTAFTQLSQDDLSVQAEQHNPSERPETPPPANKNTQTENSSQIGNSDWDLTPDTIIRKRLGLTQDTFALSTCSLTQTSTVTPSASKKPKVQKEDDNLFAFFAADSEADGRSFTAKVTNPNVEVFKTSDVEKGSNKEDDDDCVIIENPAMQVFSNAAKKYASYCSGCGNHGNFCHDNRYRRYCIKAVYGFLHNKMKNCHWAHPWNDHSPLTASDVFKLAYNDIRRIDLELRYGYFNPNWMEVPDCMMKNSYQDAMSLPNNPKLVKMLKSSNENGYQTYYRAKGEYVA